MLILQAQDNKLVSGNPAFKFKSADETDYCVISCNFPGALASCDNKMQKHDVKMDQRINGDELIVRLNVTKKL